MTERWNYDIINRMHTCRVCKLTLASRTFIILNISGFRASSSFSSNLDQCVFCFGCLDIIFIYFLWVFYIDCTSIFHKIPTTFIASIVFNVTLTCTSCGYRRMLYHRALYLGMSACPCSRMIVVTVTICSRTGLICFTGSRLETFSFSFGGFLSCFFGSLS